MELVYTLFVLNQVTLPLNVTNMSYFRIFFSNIIYVSTYRYLGNYFDALTYKMQVHTQWLSLVPRVSIYRKLLELPISKRERKKSTAEVDLSTIDLTASNWKHFNSTLSVKCKEISFYNRLVFVNGVRPVADGGVAGRCRGHATMLLLMYSPRTQYWRILFTCIELTSVSNRLGNVGVIYALFFMWINRYGLHARGPSNATWCFTCLFRGNHLNIKYISVNLTKLPISRIIWHDIACRMTNKKFHSVWLHLWNLVSV